MTTASPVSPPANPTFRDQFAWPQGFQGRIVGHLLALKNQRRGRWVVAQLQLEPGHRVLEIGFGPGADLARVSKRVTEGMLAGVDPSDVMLAQAQRRNRAVARAGRLVLERGTAEKLPFASATFDRVFAINSVQFWGDVDACVAEARRVLAPGGRLVIAIQPRNRGATAATADAWAQRLATVFETAGLVDIADSRLDIAPVPVACVQGTAPGAATR